ncbi:hypothetical protein C8N35_10599 [Breoghania corrubedonensis]|uniref:Uncharacterized protein n=1 Tax=Breoghania corrubedonensis TaxID=665038 RepID=A0A2T5V8K7_9HYPH|nr:hypothetical protein C8N35_10599 [Breoghania corrubedonensis]
MSRECVTGGVAPLAPSLPLVPPSAPDGASPPQGGRGAQAARPRPVGRHPPAKSGGSSTFRECRSDACAFDSSQSTIGIPALVACRAVAPASRSIFSSVIPDAMRHARDASQIRDLPSSVLREVPGPHSSTACCNAPGMTPARLPFRQPPTPASACRRPSAPRRSPGSPARSAAWRTQGRTAARWRAPGRSDPSGSPPRRSSRRALSAGSA